VGAALLGVGAVAVAPLHAQDARKVETQLRDLESEAQQLQAEPLRKRDLRSPRYVEERLTDGELFYKLQDYVRASIILTDIVENYPNHAATPDAMFLLGESLYAAGDYMGARTRLRQLIDRSEEPAFRSYASRALGRLIEIAIRTRDFTGVDAYFDKLSRLPPREVEASTAYFRAKYLYNRAVPSEDLTRTGSDLQATSIDAAGLEEARRGFEAVSENSPYYPQARYFVGVVLTLQRQFPQAVEAFRRVLRAPVTTPEHSQVVELAQLSLGRLYYETDQLDQALDAYQAVPRTSRWFDVALYEIAWVYIRMGDSTRAERALEVLSIAAPDSRYLAEGGVLRGNLLLRDGRLDDAAKVFAQSTSTYAPVRDKLDAMMNKREDALAYFRSLVQDNLEVFDATTILPAEAAPFAADEVDMDRALHVLSDLSLSRRAVRETGDLVRRLEGALHAPNAVNVFVDLRRQRQRTTALRNRATGIRRELLAAQAKRTPSAGSAELAAIRAERRKLEAALSGMPTDAEDFANRDDDMLTGFRDMSRELSKLEVELLGMDARIVATERFVEDTQDARENAEGVAAMQSELGGQRGAVEQFRAQLAELKFQVESGRLQVGVGDARYVRDDEVRARYNELAEQERALLASLGLEPDAQVDAMFRRLVSVEATLARRDAEIEQVLSERRAEIEGALAQESSNVESYRNQLASLETEAEDVVGGVAYTNFAAVRDRVYDLVLRADVGTIDVSWAEREEHRMRVEILTRERAREMRALDDEYKEIVDEPTSGGEQ
jgi:TolA-binding protein